jgi:ZIP family zinc transporter
MAMWLQAGGWAMLAAAALLVGALIGWFVPLSHRVVASVMAFGAGVLIAAVVGEVVGAGVAHGGLLPVAGGLLAGALAFTLANLLLVRHGAAHRKRSGDQQRPAGGDDQSALAIALAAALDGIPESLLIGVSLLGGGHVALPVLLAFLISNLPEGLSSAAGMRRAGRSAAYTFGLWAGIVLVSGVAGAVGFLALAGAGPVALAVTSAVAAGAILAMLADTMIPEAFDGTQQAAGMITVIGFVTALAVDRLAG